MMPNLVGKLDSLPLLEFKDFQERILAMVKAGHRVASFFGCPTQNSSNVILNALLINDGAGSLTLLRTQKNKNESYRSLTPNLPQLHCFERECF